MSEVKKDRYGRPCPIADALITFRDPMEEAKAKSPYELTHTIAKLIREITDRDQHTGAALEMMKGAALRDGDDEMIGTIAMASEYGLGTSHKMFDLFGAVLAALEAAGAEGIVDQPQPLEA